MTRTFFSVAQRRAISAPRPDFRHSLSTSSNADCAQNARRAGEKSWPGTAVLQRGARRFRDAGERVQSKVGSCPVKQLGKPVGGQTVISSKRPLDPVFTILAPRVGGLSRTSGREEMGGTAEQGDLHCRPSGAGHFVKRCTTASSTVLCPRMPRDWVSCAAATSASTQTRSMPKRRPSATRALPVRPESARLHRGLAARQRNPSWLLDLTAAALAKDGALSNSRCGWQLRKINSWRSHPLPASRRRGSCSSM